MTAIEAVLSGFAGGGATVVVVAFLFKSFLKQQFSKELEAHKAKLLVQADVLRNQLNMLAHAHNVAASRHDGQRSESIAAIYRQFRKVVNHLLDLRAEYSTGDDISKSFAVAQYARTANGADIEATALTHLVMDHVIFIDDATACLLNEFTSLARRAFEPMQLALPAYDRAGEPDWAAIAAARMGAIRLWHEELPDSAEAITNAFRTRLAPVFAPT